MMKTSDSTNASLRLLIVTTSRTIHGGVENIVYDLHTYLPQHGIEVVVGLTKGLRFNDPDNYRKAFPNLISVDIDGTKGTRQGRMEGLYQAIYRVKPDIVLLARVFDTYEVVSKLKKKGLSIRLVLTVQGYEPHYLYDAWLYRHNIDLCMAAGKLIRNSLIYWSQLPSDRVVSIPNGVRLPEIPIQLKDFKDRIKICYIGRLDSGQKRIMDLIPTLELMKKRNINFSFDIIGTGTAEMTLKKRLIQFTESGIVKFHGWMDRETLYEQIYPKVDMLLHFASYEGVPMVLSEAMAHGIIPVVSEFVGLKAEGLIINEHNALVFPVGDTLHAVDCVERIMKNQEFAQTLSLEAMKSITGIYTLEGTMATWAKSLYECSTKPLTSGSIPKLKFPPDGRLAHFGLPPWILQRIRDVFGKPHIHADGGGEWPTGSGLMPKEKEVQLLNMIKDFDN